VASQREEQQEHRHSQVEAGGASALRIQQGDAGENQPGNAGEDGHLPKVAAAPVDVPRQIAEEPGCDKGEQVFHRERKHPGVAEAEFRVAEALPESGQPWKELRRGQGRRRDIDGGDGGERAPADGRLPDGIDHRLQSRGDRGIKHILHMSGQYLQARRGARQQQALDPAVAVKLLQAGEDPGRPCHGADIREMAGVQVGKHGSGQRKQHGAQPRGQRVQAPPGRQAMHPPAEDDQVHQQREIGRPAKRQEKEDDVGRIEQRRLESAQEGLARIRVGIPERQVAREHVLGGKGPPGQELMDQVRIGASDHEVGRNQEDNRHHRGQQRGGNEEARTDTPYLLWR